MKKHPQFHAELWVLVSLLTFLGLRGDDNPARVVRGGCHCYRYRGGTCHLARYRHLWFILIEDKRAVRQNMGFHEEARVQSDPRNPFCRQVELVRMFRLNHSARIGEYDGVSSVFLTAVAVSFDDDSGADDNNCAAEDEEYFKERFGFHDVRDFWFLTRKKHLRDCKVLLDYDCTMYVTGVNG